MENRKKYYCKKVPRRIKQSNIGHTGSASDNRFIAYCVKVSFPKSIKEILILNFHISCYIGEYVGIIGFRLFIIICSSRTKHTGNIGYYLH